MKTFDASGESTCLPGVHWATFVYHLPKKAGNFGWNVNGKPILVFPNGKCPVKGDFSKASPKLPNGKRVYHLHSPMILPPSRLSRLR